MKVYLVRIKRSLSELDLTNRWLITAANEVKLFWEVDKYLDPYDTEYYEVKKQSISLKFNIKDPAPEYKEEVDFCISIDEGSIEGLYELVDREGGFPWRPFDPDKNFYEQAYDMFIDKTELEVYCEVCDTSYYPDDTCKLH